MRKLHLASLNYTLESHEYVMTRIVVVTDDDRKSGLIDSEIATEKARQWFSKNIPNGDPLSIVAYEAIDQPLQISELKKENEEKEAFAPVDASKSYRHSENAICLRSDCPQCNSVILDAAWFGADDIPKEAGLLAGFSDDVLIDVDGYRKNYIVGWYDIDEKEWRSACKDFAIEPTMKWQYLPLAKYDK